VFEKTQQLNGVPVEQVARGSPAWQALEHSMAYFRRRAAIVEDVNSSAEQRWFTLLKMGEMLERYYHDRRAAVRHYLQCARTDAERSDGWFLAAQGLRLMGHPHAALPLLMTAVDLPMPARVMFHWAPMYGCVPQGELGNVVATIAVTEAEVAAAALDRERSRKRRQQVGDLVGNLSAGGVESADDVAAAVQVPDNVVARLLLTAPRLQRYHIEAAIRNGVRAQRTCPPSESGVLADVQNALPHLRQQLAEYKRLEQVLQRRAAAGAAAKTATLPATRLRVSDEASVSTAVGAGDEADGWEGERDTFDAAGASDGNLHTPPDDPPRSPPSTRLGAPWASQVASELLDALPTGSTTRYPRLAALQRGELDDGSDAVGRGADGPTCRQVRAATVAWHARPCATMLDDVERAVCAAAARAYVQCVILQSR
jgi:hypothetical protein